MTEYQKFLLNNAAISSGMLGEFSLEYKYILPKNIIDELLKLKKMITSFKENEIKCEANVGDNKFNFVITMIDDAETKKRYSSLYLDEKYKFMGQENNQQTFLVSFADDPDNMYFEKLKKSFNLTTKDETEGKDISEENKILQELLKDKKALSKQMPALISLNDKQYVYEVLKMLKTAGPFGIRMQKLFKEKMDKLNIDKNSAQYWIALKAILDSILYENLKDCKDEEFKKWLEMINQNYILMYMGKKNSLNQKKAQEKVAKKSKGGPEKKKEPTEFAKSKPSKKDKAKSKDGGKSKSVAKDEKIKQVNSPIKLSSSPTKSKVSSQKTLSGSLTSKEYMTLMKLNDEARKFTKTAKENSNVVTRIDEGPSFQ